MDKQDIRRSLVIAGLLGAFAAAGQWYRPTELYGKHRPGAQLSGMVPTQFGVWTALPENGNTLADPVASEKLRQIYTDLLSRTYTDGQGNTVMFSAAYVLNHSDAGSVHYPNVCYPSQGFEIQKEFKTVMNLHGQRLPMHRMFTTKGPRKEPVSYWVVVGDEATTSPNEAKLAQLKLTVHNYIADGMLVRVSTLNGNPEQAWQVEESFINSLYAVLSPQARLRLFGRQP